MFIFQLKTELLIYLFAREVLLVKKLEIEETKTTQYSTFKTDIIKVGLLFSISKFFFTKTSLANKWMRKKTLLAEIQLYTISKPNLQIKVNKTKSHLSLTIIFLLLTPQLALVVATKVVLAKLLWQQNHAGSFTRNFIHIDAIITGSFAQISFQIDLFIGFSTWKYLQV